MKVVLLNYSGNAGKTTIACHLLKPRMADVPIFSIESINSGADANGLEVEKMKGSKFGELIDELMLLDSAIVDVGASNVEDFLRLMNQFDGSHEEFDYFIVPVVKERKVQADTVNTIRSLRDAGVKSKKIKVVFNKLDLDEDIRSEFAGVVGFGEAEKAFTLNMDAAIYSNEVFERLKSVGKSLGEITADPTDYRTQLRAAKDDDEKNFCIRMIALKRLGVTANKNLDNVFKALALK